MLLKNSFAASAEVSVILPLISIVAAITCCVGFADCPGVCGHTDGSETIANSKVHRARGT